MPYKFVVYVALSVGQFPTLVRSEKSASETGAIAMLEFGGVIPLVSTRIYSACNVA
jgi:hypothetical protein